MYAYPNRVTQKLLDAIASHDALCKYIDMPLQHASPTVLKRMKRGGSGEIFLKLLERIRSTIPGVAIRTTMIAGFPGETEADFEQLRQFVEAAQFDHLGVFAYSDESASASFHLDGKVDRRTSERHRRQLLALQKKISRAKLRRMVGQVLPILVDGPSAESELVWEGRLMSQALEIDGKTYITDVEGLMPKPGSMGQVRITKSHDYDLEGTWLGPVPNRHPFPSRDRQGAVLRVLQ
jgi:ribosomal protein S12 methylthiotransferase